MNHISRILTTTGAAVAAVAVLSFSQARAEEKEHDPGHDHAKVAGPNGGKIIHDVEPHAELLVTKDRKLQFTFLNEKMKAGDLKDQSVSAICGERSAPTRMVFEKKGNTLLSDKPLPKGLNIPTVIQIKMTPESKTKVLRINLNLEPCGGCKFLEYACTCDHDHEKEKEKK